MENFKKHTVMCKKQEISRLEGSELLSKSFNLHNAECSQQTKNQIIINK